MSLAKLTSRDSVTINRLSTTRGTAGGQLRTYSEGNRGELPSSWTCRIQPIGGEEKREFGIRAERLAWKLLGTSNPTITVLDQVSFTDADEIDRTTRVIEPSRNLDGQGRLYRAIVEEVGNEK